VAGQEQAPSAGPPLGVTDDGRFRRLTVRLPPEYVRRLFEACDAGASDQQMCGIIAEGFNLALSRVGPSGS
jgi:hypothetical protein